jgi:hypothetical protein
MLDYSWGTNSFFVLSLLAEPRNSKFFKYMADVTDAAFHFKQELTAFRQKTLQHLWKKFFLPCPAICHSEVSSDPTVE